MVRGLHNLPFMPRSSGDFYQFITWNDYDIGKRQQCKHKQHIKSKLESTTTIAISIWTMILISLLLEPITILTTQTYRINKLIFSRFFTLYDE